MKSKLLAKVFKRYLDNFEKHEAIWVVDTDEVQVVDCKNESSNYTIKYVINRNHLYLSGDLASAVFDLTWFHG